MLTIVRQFRQNLSAMNAKHRSDDPSDRHPAERDLRIALGKRIRRMRERKSWSRPVLAERIGVTRSALLRWERGALPPLGMLIILSEVLEMSLDALLAGRSTEAEAALTSDQRKDAALLLNRLAGLLGLRAKK